MVLSCVCIRRGLLYDSEETSLYLPVQRLVETFNLHCYDNVDIVRRNEQERKVQ